MRRDDPHAVLTTRDALATNHLVAGHVANAEEVSIAALGKGSDEGAVAAAGGFEDDEDIGLERANPGGNHLGVIGQVRGRGVRQVVEVEGGAREVAADDGAWHGEDPVHVVRDRQSQATVQGSRRCGRDPCSLTGSVALGGGGGRDPFRSTQTNISPTDRGAFLAEPLDWIPVA